MECAAIRKRVAAAAEVLSDVGTPCLVHGDLWQANVFVEIEGEECRITGIIDWERALWADPLCESMFVSRQARPSFFAGYTAGGSRASVDWSDRELERIRLYRIFFYIYVLLVEEVRSLGLDRDYTTRVGAALAEELEGLGGKEGEDGKWL
jgi:fructosamine-3-kinase